MKTFALIVTVALSFVAPLPLSLRLADPLFSRPFDKTLHNDAVLMVCPDHVQVLWLHKMSADQSDLSGTRCTFNVAPDRQKWVENAVRVLPSPNPLKASWTIRVKQVRDAEQQIDLELLGDGIWGMVYEVKRDEIVPLQSRLTGPGGAIYFLVINVALWVMAWCVFWIVRRIVLQRWRS